MCIRDSLNTAIADTLMKMADELEGAEDMTTAVDALIRKTLSAHMRIIFNGNGYDQAWVEEAKRRGLLNLPTTVDALPYYVAPKNIAMFERQKVFTREEVESRYEIKMETYIKVIDIEALSTIDISRHLILPAAIAYAKDVAATIDMKKSVAPELEAEAEKALLSNLTAQTNALYKATDRLEAVLKAGDEGADMLERARSVSYTHLEVYKRQIPRASSWACTSPRKTARTWPSISRAPSPWGTAPRGSCRISGLLRATRRSASTPINLS